MYGADCQSQDESRLSKHFGCSPAACPCSLANSAKVVDLQWVAVAPSELQHIMSINA